MTLLKRKKNRSCTLLTYKFNVLREYWNFLNGMDTKLLGSIHRNLIFSTNRYNLWILLEEFSYEHHIIAHVDSSELWNKYPSCSTIMSRGYTLGGLFTNKRDITEINLLLSLQFS